MTLQVVLEFHLLLPFYQKIISAFQRLPSSVLPAQVWYKLLQVHPHSLDQVLLKSLDPSLQIEQPCQIQIPHQVDLEGLELRVHQVVLAFPLLLAGLLDLLGQDYPSFRLVHPNQVDLLSQEHQVLHFYHFLLAYLHTHHSWFTWWSSASRWTSRSIRTFKSWHSRGTRRSLSTSFTRHSWFSRSSRRSYHARFSS